MAKKSGSNSILDNLMAERQQVVKKRDSVIAAFGDDETAKSLIAALDAQLQQIDKKIAAAQMVLEDSDDDFDEPVVSVKRTGKAPKQSKVKPEKPPKKQKKVLDADAKREAKIRANLDADRETDEDFQELLDSSKAVINGVASKRKNNKPNDSFASYPHLLEIKPKERYVFHGDYYTADNYYCCILSYFHAEGAHDGYAPFWGINKIPGSLPDGVVVVCLEQARRMTEGWLADHQSRTEGISQMNENEQNRGGNNTSRGRAKKNRDDLQEIANELQNGASYLHVHYRLLVKAPSLDVLDDAINRIDRMYIDRFATLSAAPYAGEQRRELSTLLSKNDFKKGKGFYFTSTEMAGSYNLVTHGLEDPTGEYVGQMVGDVNNSAVLFDVNKYKHHVVVANESFATRNGDRMRVADMWGSKISQSCMLNNGRVVHIILNNANLNRLGPELNRITARIDMNNGDVNMFEMFGDTENELQIFPTHIRKLTLMAELLCDSTPEDRAIIRGNLEDVATKFYVDKGMWRDDAKNHRNELRIVGIPHSQVPKLDVFTSYLDTRYKAVTSTFHRDEEQIHAVNILRMTFKSLLSNNGDLFNTTTSAKIDKTKACVRVIYDFSSLTSRGPNIAMAQLVNIIGFAVDNLGRGDTIVIHGAEHIDDSVKGYMHQQFDRLYENGGRVAFIYGSVDRMLSDRNFNEFDKSDYMVLGNMTVSSIQTYQDMLGQKIPTGLFDLIANKSSSVCYIRRGFDIVVFNLDLPLGIGGVKIGGAG